MRPAGLLFLSPVRRLWLEILVGLLILPLLLGLALGRILGKEWE